MNIICFDPSLVSDKSMTWVIRNAVKFWNSIVTVPDYERRIMVKFLRKISTRKSYNGIICRFSNDLVESDLSSEFLIAWGESVTVDGKSVQWLDMPFEIK